MNKQHTPAGSIAAGGILAAFAVVIMVMGTMIPVATFVCPALCMLLLQFVKKTYGFKTAWAWYGTVAILAILFAPDKEAACIFLFLGYYPILKLWFDSRKGKLIWKFLYFNGSIFTAYQLMIHLIGLEQVINDLDDAGSILAIVLLLLGNCVFYLLDRLLGMAFGKTII